MPTATTALPWLKTWAEEVGLAYLPEIHHQAELWKYVDFTPIEKPFASLTLVQGAPLDYPDSDGFRSVGHWHNGQWAATPALGVRSDVVDARKLPETLTLGSPGNLFSVLANQASDTALVVTVAPGLHVETPLSISFSASDLDNVGAPQRLHVHVGTGATACILIQNHAQDCNRVLFNRMTTIHLEPNAHLEWVVMPDASGVLRTESTCVVADAGATLKGFTVHTQTPFAFHEVQVYFRGEGSQAKLNGLGLLRNHDKLYQHIEVHHDVPHTQSFQLYKSILADQAVSEYTGLVKVAPHAQKTLSGQLNRNLMLSGIPQAHSRPQLQIYADDVKCNHGATVGQLDPQELFYLVSRGLSPETATGLLTQGFADEVVAQISDDAVRRTVRHYADGFLRGRHV